MSTDVSPRFLQEFVDSMPPIYHESYDRPAMVDHARVVLEREARSANVGVFPAEDGVHATVCMVADDRPGVLASMSAALVNERLDVVDAEAHTRRGATGAAEAVDIFWVRRAEGERPPSPADARALRETLCALLEGRLDARELGGVSPLRPGGETVVRFVEGADRALSTLEVETDDQSGLLLALSRALFETRVQIAQSEVRTLGGRVYDRFHVCELDGRPISASRRLEIQVAVLAAIQPG